MQPASKYPTDRIVFFSDAVFAIAITLLVIEIKVPTHDIIHEIGLGQAIQKLTPLFVGYIISFIVSALFWKSHLVVCHWVKDFTPGLLWLNTFLLLFVALMPFSTALYSENFGNNVAYVFYCLNLAAIGLFNYWMHVYVAKKESLQAKIGDKENRWFKMRSLIVPVVFMLCAASAYFLPRMSRYGFVLIFVFQLIGERIYKRK